MRGIELSRTLGFGDMARFSNRIAFVASVFLALNVLAKPAMTAPSTLPAEHGKATGTHPHPAKVTAAKSASSKARDSYFIEFRSRYALSYGHSFVIFGKMGPDGKMIDPEVAGLHPASDSVIPYMLGHIIPVPAETGWSDGDLEDQYKSANWRIMVSEPEYNKVVAYIRKKQAGPKFWHAGIYNGHAFARDIAQFMGYKTPSIWVRPQEFMTKLRLWNGGPNAIGSTGAPG